MSKQEIALQLTLKMLEQRNHAVIDRRLKPKQTDEEFSRYCAEHTAGIFNTLMEKLNVV